MNTQEDMFNNTQSAEVVDLGGGAELLYVQKWLNAEEAQRLFEEFQHQLPWQQPEIRVAGRTLPIPRLQCWYGDPQARLKYSGKVFEPLPWSASLAALRARLIDYCACPFNSVLVNLYRDGQDSVGWHADDERELGTNPCIASVSLGQRRSFQIKPKRNYARNSGSASDDRWVFDLGEGDLLVMRGTTQQHWQHALPKSQKNLGPRINLTFREVKDRISANY